MTRRARLRDLRASIRTLADPARAERVRIAVPGVRTNGAAVPKLRALAKQIPTATSEAAFTELCGLMDDLVHAGPREEFLVGTFLIGRHQRSIRSLKWTRVAAWVAAVDNWETCDQLSAEVLATMVDADPSLGAKLHQLARARSKWHRRVAVATAASLNQRGRSQPAITTAICDMLADDAEPMIRRAVAWARRELAKRTA